jgi:hypothetical protein
MLLRNLTIIPARSDERLWRTKPMKANERGTSDEAGLLPARERFRTVRVPLGPRFATYSKRLEPGIGHHDS